MTAVICCDLSLVFAKSFLVGLPPLGMSNGKTSTIHLRMKAWIVVFRFKRENFYESGFACFHHLMNIWIAWWVL